MCFRKENAENKDTDCKTKLNQEGKCLKKIRVQNARQTKPEEEDGVVRDRHLISRGPACWLLLWVKLLIAGHKIDFEPCSS